MACFHIVYFSIWKQDKITFFDNHIGCTGIVLSVQFLIYNVQTYYFKINEDFCCRHELCHAQ